MYEGLSGGNIYQRLRAQCEIRVSWQRRVFKTKENFKEGSTSVRPREGAGHPTASTTEDDIERGREPIILDNRVTVDDVTEHLQISHDFPSEMIHHRLIR